MSEYTVAQLIRNHEKAFIPEKAEGLSAIIQYILTGEEGGDWIIYINEGRCAVDEGVADSATVTLTSDANDFRDVLLGNANGMKYFMEGKIKLAGDLNLAMKLTSMFKMSG